MSLTNIQIPVFKADINAAANAGALGGFISAGNDAAVANYYNNPSSGLTSTAILANRYDVLMWAASGDVLSNLTQASLTPVSGNNKLHSAALGFLKLLQTDGTLLVGEVGIVRLATTLIQNGVVKNSDFTNLQKTVLHSPASSGEALFGTGTVITNSDVSLALRGY